MNNVEEIALELQEFISSILIDHDVLKNLKVDLRFDYRHELAAMQINAMMEVLGRDFPVETYQHPAGWWQCFKKEYLPALSRYFPVKYTVVELRAKELYPSIKVPQHCPHYWKILKVNNEIKL